MPSAKNRTYWFTSPKHVGIPPASSPAGRHPLQANIFRYFCCKVEILLDNSHLCDFMSFATLCLRLDNLRLRFILPRVGHAEADRVKRVDSGPRISV
jgi:hypothetical protein